MTDLTIADVLERAADLIEPEGKWTQGESARTADGQVVFAPHKDAVCWCLYGAIAQVGGANCDFNSTTYLASRFIEKGEETLAAWNDAPERTQAEVVAKLREAAALARAAS